MAGKLLKNKNLDRAASRRPEPKAGKVAKLEKPAKPAKVAAPKAMAKDAAKAKDGKPKDAAKLKESPKLKEASKAKDALKPKEKEAAKGKNGLGKDAKAKDAAKPKDAPKKKRKGSGVVRLKAFWGIFNQMLKRVAVFEYAERKQADKKAAELSANGKQPHFVQLVKEVIRDAE